MDKFKLILFAVVLAAVMFALGMATGENLAIEQQVPCEHQP